jgi:hypothetical protein
MAASKYNVDDLMLMFNEYRAYKQSILREWRLTRSLYKGEFWQVFKKHLKEYTVTPDWNYFEYVVQAYLNSVYSGAFIGTLTPVHAEDETYIQNLNAFIAYHWNKWGLKNKFLHIGENGELYNLGALRVDWDSNKGVPIIHALSPEELYFDPSVSSYKEGAAIFIERAVNIDKLKKNENFKKGVEEYLKKHKNNIIDKTIPNRLAGFENRTTSKNRTVSLIECFIRNEDGNFDQIYILDESTIIHEKLDLPIHYYPIVSYAPQRSDAGPYGNAKITKIINTVIALNLLDSLEATQPYRILNRPRFVNVDGRINMRAFADYGNTPNASFEVKGDPRTIVYYQDIPTIPDLTNLKNRLENSIFQVTGVDPYYKGRMTNSIQTTGATQAFQARVTMLTDNSRITMLEEFCEDLTKLILDFYFVYGGDRTYKVPKLSATGTRKVIDHYKVNFSELRNKSVQFDYMISASTLLPMNQANLFESAKALYEMQGQYGFKKRVITEQDLVRYSDFPQKDLLLQRLEKEEQTDTAEQLIADLTNFASIFSRLLSSGLSEEQAAQEAIAILIEEKNQMLQDPTLGQGFK